MDRGWLSTLKTVALTAALTSIVWLGVGLWWLGTGQYRQSSTAPDARSTGPVVDIRGKSSAPETPITGDVPAPRRSAIAMPGKLLIPVANVEADDLLDTFEQARAGGARRHDAIDIMAPTGTPVLAAAQGKVEKLFLSEAGGKTIYIRAENGTRIHYYAHLDTYAPGIVEGDIVRRGQQIGTVGSSGNADPNGPHLHFEVMATSPSRKWHEEKSVINPYPLLVGR